MSKRVKYYPKNDYGFARHLDKIENLREYIDIDGTIEDVNDVLELYNIKKYIDNEVYHKDWNAEDKIKYKSFVESFVKNISKYFNSLNNENIIDIFMHVEINYIDDFFKNFECYKLYKRIAYDVFNNILISGDHKVYSTLVYILLCKELVKHYELDIANHMKANVEQSIYLFYTMHTQHEPKLQIPKCLSEIEVNDIVEKYIKNEKINTNYINALLESKKVSNLKINPEILLSIENKINQVQKEYFSNNIGFSYECNIGFTYDEIKYIHDYTECDNKFQILFDKNWIETNLDYPTILNNYIHVFGIIDKQIRISNTLKKSKTNLYDILTQNNLEKSYNINLDFETTDIIHNSSFMAYYNLLLDNNIYLEKIIEWFFKDYLPKEFNILNYNIKMSSNSSTEYWEKNSIIDSCIEGILKYYDIYTKYGHIELGIYKYFTLGKIDSIKSKINNKYVYLDDSYIGICNLLFSDQSGMCYIDEFKRANNFVELIEKNDVYRSDFIDVDIDKLDYLIKKNIIKFESCNEKIKLTNICEVIILNELYCIGFINRHNFNWLFIEEKLDNFNKAFDNLDSKGALRYGSTLLSEQESSYFNYYLNNSEFNNALALRNLYSHAGAYSILNEDTHKQHYFTFLKLIIMLIIKINDELCLREKLGL